MKIDRTHHGAIAAEYANRLSTLDPFPDYDEVYEATLAHLNKEDRAWRLLKARSDVSDASGDDSEPLWKMIPFERDTLMFLYELLADYHESVAHRAEFQSGNGQEHLRDVRIARNDLIRAWSAGREV